MFSRKKISPSGSNDEQLMQQACNGDREAFEMLYDRYFNKLVWFAQGFTSDVQQAEDLVQDVFIKVIERPEQFDRSRKFSTWIYVVTANLCRQAIRNQKNRSRIIDMVVLPNTETVSENLHRADHAFLRQSIQAGYAQLSEKEKNIYTLRFEQDMNIKEIAEIIGIPEGSVKSGIYYLLRKFAIYLKDFDHEH